MVVVHIVLFKFRDDTSEATKSVFLSELKKLKQLPCVVDQKLVVGGPSITTPASRSKGFHYCLLSYHKDRAALDEYQASPEHHHVTSTYMWPFNDDLMRFDFETADDSILGSTVSAALASVAAS
ncbi:uncharacterized protein PV07_02302 [Cladophialophora immunda]|uniref:Stress-response A/B barrel domain-containing protein n=1 Tax=Cladophialophora immunda TaxID=569365 RepID=A0A0D2A5H8_9EURO|nr:uncharacterized protein PV07_02302 [Cladophialophora immunda]KIW35616.1 hypothetical protein PV07_02302 [Cladophialophora immunda]